MRVGLRSAIAAATLLLAAGATDAGTYYVRADGTAGTKTQATGCGSRSTALSVGVLNGTSFSPGDRIILCHEGGVYRSTVYASSDGNSSAPVTYDGRGTAVIAGSDVVTGWTRWSGNIYSASFSVPLYPNRPEQVFINGQFGDRKRGTAELTGNLDWYWANDTLYLYSSSGDPDVVYANPGVEAGKRDVCFGLGGRDWVVVQGVTARHANHGGIWAFNPGSHLTIRDNVSEWNWNVGIIFGGDIAYGYTTIEGNVSRNNGIGGIALLNLAYEASIRRNRCYSNGKYQSKTDQFSDQHTWTYGIKLWDSGTRQEGHDIAFNECFDNGRGNAGDYQDRGNGIWLDGVPGNPSNPTYIRHNLIYDNRANGIFLEMAGHTVTYGNVLHGNGSVGGGDQFAPANIAIDSRENRVSENNLVFNNTAYGGRYGIKVVTYNQYSGCSVRYNVIKNNIVVAASEHNLYANFGGDNDGVWGYGNVYANNAFGPESNDFISWNGIGRDTYAQWQSAYGQATYSITGDPQLAGNQPNTLFLLATSPCRDAGESLGSTYFEGLRTTSVWPQSVVVDDHRLYGTGWEVGAYLYDAAGAYVIFNSDFEALYAPGDWSHANP